MMADALMREVDRNGSKMRILTQLLRSTAVQLESWTRNFCKSRASTDFAGCGISNVDNCTFVLASTSAQPGPAGIPRY
eukprot:COSAG05_NODE_633_length_8198_cov_7.449191_3_plen_78_part_00